MNEQFQEDQIISIVVPCLNEASNVVRCYEAICRTFDTIPNADFQIIFVDDGSTDGTVQQIKSLAVQDSRCALIVNSRNYGVYRSSFHALRYVKGDATIPMLPVDLQDPPELIAEFVSLWRQGNRVVAGVRYEREENWLMKSVRRTYYRIASRLADFDLPRYVGEFQLLDKSVVSDLASIDDYYPYTRGLIASLTNSRVLVPYTWKKREVGKSNMNSWRLLDQGINGIVSTSSAPLRVLSLVSAFVALIGVIFGVVQVIAYFTFARAITEPGISTLIVLVSLFAAFNAVSFGVLAEYIAAIHSQVRGRWRVVEKEKINLGGMQL